MNGGLVDQAKQQWAIACTGYKQIVSSGHGSEDRLSSVGLVLSGYTGGFKLVEGVHEDALERFYLLGKKNSPRLLLPVSKPLLGPATKGFLAGRRRAVLLPFFVRTSIRIGGPFAQYCREYSLVSKEQSVSPIRQLLSSVLQRNDFQIALRFSFGRPNGKTVAMAISNAGEILCYAKIGSEPVTSSLVSHESLILKKFENTDLPVIVPRHLYSGTWKTGHDVLVTEPIELKPLPTDASCAHKASYALTCTSPTQTCHLNKSLYWADLIKRVEEASKTHDESRELMNIALSDIDRKWGRCSTTFGISHGDWTRANTGLVNGRVAGVDWERCLQLAPQGIDIAHFAISENTTRSMSRDIDLDQVLAKAHEHLSTAGVSADIDQCLILLALLEMVIRFKSAGRAGIRSKDSKFEVALQSALSQWAV